MAKAKRLSLRIFWQLLKGTVTAWLDNKAPRLGAALAFYSILSLAPLLVIILAIATTVWGGEATQGEIVDQMKGFVGETGAEAIQGILAASAKSHDAGFVAGLIGFITLLFSASGVFGELQAAMNIIWKAPPRKEKQISLLIREKLFSFMMVLGTGVLLLVSLLISAALAVVARYVNALLPAPAFIMQTVDFLASFGIAIVLFAIIFKIVPDLTVPWRSVWVGSCLTAILFMIGKLVIGVYLTHAGVASSYGAAGSIIILLLWIYYSSQILFFGAEFTYIYACYFDLHLPIEQA